MPRRTPYTLNLNVPDSSSTLTVRTAVTRRSTHTAPTLTQQKATAAKRYQQAMSIAIRPGQQILMNAFMLWMAGSQLNIFSISIVSMAVSSPLQGLWSLSSTFGPLEEAGTNNLTIPKLVSLALHLAWLGLGCYKLSSMRLLPTTSADFVHRIVWPTPLEVSSA